jgi:mRNA interferase MazF
VVVEQAEVWWADLDEPTGPEAGYRRPVVVVQGNALNRSRIGTVVCVPLTSNLKWAIAPGKVLLSRQETGLSKESVANVSLIVALDRKQLTERVGKVPPRRLQLILAGIDTVLGR